MSLLFLYVVQTFRSACFSKIVDSLFFFAIF